MKNLYAMANEIHYTKLGGCFFIAALTSFMLSNAFADCRKVETLKTEASVKHNNAVIKTIKVAFPILRFLFSLLGIHKKLENSF